MVSLGLELIIMSGISNGNIFLGTKLWLYVNCWCFFLYDQWNDVIRV